MSVFQGWAVGTNCGPIVATMSYSCFSMLTRRSRAHDSQPLAQRQLATDIVTVVTNTATQDRDEGERCAQDWANEVVVPTASKKTLADPVVPEEEGVFDHLCEGEIITHIVSEEPGEALQDADTQQEEQRSAEQDLADLLEQQEEQRRRAEKCLDQQAMLLHENPSQAEQQTKGELDRDSISFSYFINEICQHSTSDVLALRPSSFHVFWSRLWLIYSCTCMYSNVYACVYVHESVCMCSNVCVCVYVHTLMYTHMLV